MLAAITCVFNPARYKSRLLNYRRFADTMDRQNVPLFTIELAYGTAPLMCPDAYMALRTYSVMWHKENLLNILVGALPPEITKVAWVDCDVEFSNDNWGAIASEMLETKEIIQLCGWLDWLNRDGTIGRHHVCSIKNYLEKVDPNWVGSTGMGWAANREFFDGVGLYDKLLVGGADWLLHFAIQGFVHQFFKSFATPALLADLESYVVLAWSDTFGYIDQTARHHWHGDDPNRNYEGRHAVLKMFDPDRDLIVSATGLLEWSPTASLELRAGVADYFKARKEDGE